MLTGLFAKLPETQDRFSIQIKAGNTNTQNTRGYSPNTTLHRAYPGKATACTMVLWCYGEQFESVEDFIQSLDDYINYYNSEHL